MAKDRAAPFSFKHKRTWLTVTGGMIAIGIANVGLGAWLWPDEPIDRTPERLVPKLPSAAPGPDAGIDARAPDLAPASAGAQMPASAGAQAPSVPASAGVQAPASAGAQATGAPAGR